jgi:Cu2+-exporting ATPase
LAQAVARLGVDATPYDQVEEVAGAGVRTLVDGVDLRLGHAAFCDAQVHQPSSPDVSLIYVRYGDQQAAIEIRQSLRPDAIAIVETLRRRGFDLHIFSGDRPDAVAPLARQLSIADAQGGMNPAQKIAAIESLRAQGRKVLMVGDGMNDAPALAAAYASLSPITAADLAQAQADAVFLSDRLAPVAQALDLARQARALMRQNLWIAVVYNAFAVPLAIAGYVTPLIAAAAMSGSSIIVTLNALRMRGVARKEQTERSAPAPLTVAAQEHRA